MTKSRGQENLAGSCEVILRRNVHAENGLQFLRSSQLKNNRYPPIDPESFPKPRGPTGL
jgi:hypothetical protein